MSKPWSIFVLLDDGKRAEFALTDGLRVGRGPNCEVRLPNPYLSREHFSFVATEAGWSVKSNFTHTAAGSGGMGAVLGTYVNDEKAMGLKPVQPGDRISPKSEPGPEHPVFEIGETVDPLSPGTAIAPAPKGCLASLFGG